MATVKLILSPHNSLGYCKDCKSVHMNPGCGLTYKERLGSVRLDESWMPAKEKKNYYDQQALDAAFGENAEETLMEETKGVGAVNQQELQKYAGWSKEITEFYTDGPEQPLNED